MREPGSGRDRGTGLGIVCIMTPKHNYILNPDDFFKSCFESYLQDFDLARQAVFHGDVQTVSKGWII